MKFLIVVALVCATGILSVECSDNLDEGLPADRLNFVYYMKLLIHVNTTNGIQIHRCGGAVIDLQWVLTAASCFINVGGKVEKVTAKVELIKKGYHDVDQTAIQVITHEGYSETNYHINNIALVEFPKIKCDLFVKPITICENTPNKLPGSEDIQLRISGYGLSENELRYNDFELLGRTQCAGRFGGSYWTNQFCVLEKNSCLGELGSPAVSLNKGLAGILSFPWEKCPSNSPTAFTQVNSFKSWIVGKTNLQIQTKTCIY